MDANLPLVAGNWKMHGSRDLVHTVARALLSTADAWATKVEIAVFPPALYIPTLANDYGSAPFVYGAQNCDLHAEGAYTGEISASMLAEFACTYVLAGHSERRSLFGETNDIVAQKLAIILANGLTPILCVGENAEQRKQNKTFAVISAQLQAILDLPQGATLLTHSVIAYEPVWAIGTGNSATPEQAQEIHSQIRTFMAQYAPTSAPIRILYGGSVKADNAAALIAMPDIDGFLVGGASLNAEQFLTICRVAAGDIF